MEGQDANTLIASRLGVEPGDVTAKLVALSQQNVLDGAADGRVDDVDDGATVNISLTLEDLEKFERYEEATAAEKQAVVLKMRPAVLGATPTRTPSAAAAATPAAATPAVPAVVHLSPTPLSQSAPAAPAALWCEEEVEMAPEEDRASTTAEPTATAEASVSETDAWPERKRYAEAVEAEEILMGIS
jgi:hypothetical protein